MFVVVILSANKEKEIELKYDLERNVKLIKFEKGQIDITFNEKLNKNFIKTLTEKLFLWTGERWVISLSKIDGAKTIYEKNLQEKSEILSREKNSDTVKRVSNTFPDAKLINVEED